MPTDFSARLARNTQLYIQDETKACKIIDPWGGSYYVEYLTNEIIRRAWAHIQEVEALGGMAKAISTGLPKMRIEECAARRQADIDSGKETIVGLNKYRLAKEDPLNVLSIDNTAVRNAQIKRLEKLRSIRDPEAVARDLEAITKAAESRENGNLLELAVQAAHDRDPSVKFPMRLKKYPVVSTPPSILFPVYIPANLTVQRNWKKQRNWPTDLKHWKAAVPVFSWLRWGRTDTTEARRFSRHPLPIWAGTST